MPGWLVGDLWLGQQGVSPSFAHVDLSPWLGLDGVRDPQLQGILVVSPLRQHVEPATFFATWLGIPGNWDASRTMGQTPRIDVGTKARRVSFDRRDRIVVFYERGNPEAVGLTHDYENDREELLVKIWTRRGQEHCHLLYKEAKRLIQAIRRDPYGQLRGGGRNWLKVTSNETAQREKRGFWSMELRFEVHVRWRPIDEPYTASGAQ